jgi:hypothetical protein
MQTAQSRVLSELWAKASRIRSKKHLSTRRSSRNPGAALTTPVNRRHRGTTGRLSRQLDVVISDAARTPVLYQREGSRIVPIDGVSAVGEVKALDDGG